MSTGQACGHLPPAEAEPKSLTVPILKGLAVGHRAALRSQEGSAGEGDGLERLSSFPGATMGSCPELSPACAMNILHFAPGHTGL